MIYISAFALTGTADFSNIKTELQNLERTISNLKVPPIKTDVATPNFSNFFSAIDKAEKQATIKIKPEVDNSFMGGLSNSLTGQKGKFSNVGKELGSSLTMGMQQQFGMAGGVATSFAGALGGVGIAAVAGLAGLAALGVASTQAAMKWEDMKTSIGRTTGLKGDNLEDLMSQLQDLRQEFGVTAEAASSMVEQAGSIGVGQSKLSIGDMSGYKQEILDFTKATAILQGAWGMSAEATSSGIGKMGSVTLGSWNIQRKARGEEEMSWADYAYKVGGTVDNLANAMGSSEEEIVTAMRNSSGAIAKWAPSEETYGKWQAMASFLIDTGASAGEAGTQIERMAASFDKKSVEISDVMGIDEGTLREKLKTDFMGTVQELGKDLAAIPESERPSTFDLLGSTESKGLVDKVVADIEAGTGKLQGAFDLALKPGNVAAGYEDVADNASKAFDRIGQAFQVSLEKIGGQLLPVVADIADAIADTWIAANEAGTALFANAQENAAKSRIEVNSVGDLAKAAGIFLGITDPDATEVSAAEMGKQTADVYTDYVNQGIKAGNFDPVSGKMKEVGKEAGKTAAEAFAEEMGESDALYDTLKKAKVSSEIASARAYGGVASDEAALAMINTATSKRKADKIISSTSTTMPGLDEYIQNTWLESHGDRTDTYTAFYDSAGKLLSDTFKGFTIEERDAAYDAFVDGIQPGIKDSARYFKSHASDFKDTVTSIWEDGAISGTEKLTASGMAKALETLKIKFPVEFEEANLQGTLDDLQLLADGKPIKLGLDTDELESTFALWLANRAPIHEAIKKQTGVVPIESSEEALYKYLKTAPKEVQDVYSGIEKATTGTYIDVESVPELVDDLGRLAPELLGYVSVQNDIATATENYRDQVKQTSSGFTVLDKEGNVLAGAHLRTSVASNILSGGLIDQAAKFVSLASATDAATSKLSSLAGVPSRISDMGYPFRSGASAASAPNIKVASTTKSQPGEWVNQFLSFVPKLGQVSKVSAQPGGGLAVLGERGEEEWVIPVSAIKGLWPESAKVDRTTINYKPFDDYPAPEIRSPSSYRWSHYPDAPNVQELNTDAIQTAWLADNQLNSKDIYSGLVRQAQLDAIGKNSVVPWFARGDIKQPDWWAEAATKLSPQYKENWEAAKGGTVPSIGNDVAATSGVTAIATRNGITVADAWSQLYGESFTEGCIGTNAPDASLQFTPSASLLSEIGRTWGEDTTAAWNQLYGEAFTEGCIGTNKPDSLLKYTPSASMIAEAARIQGGAWGSQMVGSSGASPSDEIESALGNIEKNTAESADKIGLAATYTGQMATVLKSPIQGFDNGNPFGQLSIGTSTPGALVTGLSKEGYLATYDPRTDTCEGLSFVAPDASLKTTDKFYLGLTENSPYRSEDESPGYGWSNVAQPMNEADAQLMKISEQSYQAQQKAAKDTAKIEENTAGMKDALGTVSGGNGVLGALVSIANGGGSWGMNGGQGGSYGSFFSGDWMSGGAAGVGVQQGGEYQPTGWGDFPSWAYQAEGGITDQPIAIFGEAGREAFVPISDRAAGLRILPQVMRELGVRQFASGGFAGINSTISAAIGPGTINLGGISIINPPQNMDEKRLAKEVVKQVEAKFYKARKR